MSFETRSYVGMPASFLENFALDEFRFRWIDALGLEMADWRTGTDLYVALFLAKFMNTSGECWPSIAAMARPMRKSEDTVRRSLRRLEENGWLIIVSQPNRTNRYQAKLPEHGVVLLLAERNAPSRSASIQKRVDVVDQLLGQICETHKFKFDALKGEKDWARVEGRMHQLVNRLGGSDGDLQLLNRWMLEGDWSEVHSPIGFILDRASKFAYAYSRASGRKVRVVQDAGRSHVEKVMRELVLANEKMMLSWGPKVSCKNELVTGKGLQTVQKMN